VTRRAISSLLALALVLSVPGVASARGPEARLDITATPRGHQLAAEAAARFSAQGVPTDARDLRAIRFASGHVVIGPAWLLAGVTISVAGEVSVGVGGLGMRPETKAGAAGARSGVPAPVASRAAPTWVTRETGCLHSLPVDSARLDSCYTISQLMSDGSGTKNYFALRQKGTAYEYEAGLRTAWLTAIRPGGSTAQTWVDWSPEQSYDDNCHSIPIGVSYGGASIGSSVVQCEKWHHDKTCNSCSPYFKSTWDCNCWFGLSNKEVHPSPISRAIAYAILVSVPQGQTPRWTLGIGLGA
jgi:hypothetical protein